MNIKTSNSNIIQIFLLSFAIFIVFVSSVFILNKTYASSTTGEPKEVFDTACGSLSSKFFLKSDTDILKLQNKYKDKILSTNDAHKYIKKILSKLGDPYTRLLTKEEFTNEQNIIKSTLIGIGIKLANKKPVILDILPNSPASQSNIKPYDYILAINDKNTSGLSSKEITDCLKGSKGTSLKLTLKRNSDVFTKEIIIDEIKLKAVTVQTLDNNIALVKISSFIPENTSNQFKEELLKLMGGRDLVIDLRNNSGGLLKNAIEIADMFLSEGKIVTTIQKFNKTNNFANSGKIFDGNIVILVNENTASASEILTSALKENGVATVIGKKTYGKGLVQEIIKLQDGSALHVTVASYLTPSGRFIDKKGITPDKIINSEEKQILTAKEILLANNKTQNIQVSLQGLKPLQ